jgi:hypothetical protein
MLAALKDPVGAFEQVGFLFASRVACCWRVAAHLWPQITWPILL